MLNPLNIPKIDDYVWLFFPQMLFHIIQYWVNNDITTVLEYLVLEHGFVNIFAMWGSQ